ncbi:MAG TPA: zinc ribbon domain-containing protein [Terriglobia bacterium]|nr:zinc ribbon domain-containing protein [Terriglobia bacterium]
MNQCKQCGATLPENSRYCLQCGTENTPGPAQPEKELDFLKPAITGGLGLGVLSALPFISALNVLCCLWAQAGGGLAVWLLDKQRPGSIKYSDGALAGVLSGLIGAIVATLVTIPIQMLLFTPEAVAQMQEALKQLPFSPAVIEAMSQFLQPGFNLTRTLISLLMNLVSLGLFAMIGGIITTAILSRKKTA